MPKDIDFESRDKIRNDINKNFFVEAGAGSGKTSVLVDRMVSMVESGIDISKICAITFTKAAADEFYARFQKKLSESKNKNAKKALKDIDLCFMGTIDSFCNMVLSEHPSKAGIPSDAGVAGDEEIAELYVKEYSRILNGEIGSTDLLSKAKLFSDYFYNASDIFIEGISILLSARNASFVYTSPAKGSIDDIFKVEKAGILSILDYLYNHPEVLSEKTKDAAAAKALLLEEYDSLKDAWDDNLTIVTRKLSVLCGLRIVREYELQMHKLGAGWDYYFAEHRTKSGTLQWYEVNPDTDPFLTDRLKNFQFALAMDFISEAAPVVADDLKSQGKLTFSDYLFYLRDLLKDDADNGGNLIKHIYDRHSYFLIDEFQDTDPIQAEVFFYLTAKTPDVDWTKCVPKPGSLFIVGDPKQSIYRFRNADVSSFIRVKDLFSDPEIGEVLYLTRNFRSSDVMCSWFNSVFSKLLPNDTATQSKFSLIPTGEKQPYSATLNGAYSYRIQNVSGLDLEDASQVASIIRRIIDDPNCTVQDRDVNGVAQSPRRPTYSDFMLITPGKGHLSSYMNAMTDLGIPYRVEGKVLFNECPSLICIYRIISAIADPFDKGARFAAEYLSGCNVTENDIFEYAKISKAMSVAGVFTMLLEKERVFEKVGVQNAEYTYFALELLRTAQSGGIVSSLKDCAKFLNDLIDSKSGEERCIQLCKDTNRVHIANLHKVKGLEAPIVILASPRGTARIPGKRIDYTEKNPKGFIFSLGSLSTNVLDGEKKKEKLVLDEEKIRLLYVAATRAGNALIVGDLCGKDGRLSSNYWLPLVEETKQIIDMHIDNAIVATPIVKPVVDAGKLYEDAEGSNVLRNKVPLEKSYEIRRPSSITLKGITSSEDDYEDKAAEEVKKAKYKKNPTLIGTLVHRLMECLVSSGNTLDVRNLIIETCREYKAEDKYYVDLLTNVANIILSGGYDQTNSAPKDILSELLSADEVYCEMPFCYSEGPDTIWHGVMDAVYRKDGIWHIVDYKTNADASDLDEHYKEQLDAYIKAFKEMTGEDADAVIYHIDI